MKHFHKYSQSASLKDWGRESLLAFSRRNLLLLAIWIFLWLSPWTIWLDSLPWLRLGISLFLFAVPGAIASIVLAGNKFSLLRHCVAGIAFSVLFVSILGILGRLLHLPFQSIKLSFAFIGLILLAVLFRRPDGSGQLFAPKSFSFTTFFVLLLIVGFGIVINLMSRTTGDDQTYLAYLTSWQHASQLNFEEVYFRSGNLDSIRFWFAMFPMSLALLSEMSNLHGLLLIGFYLEPFLIPIAILATYDLYEGFLQSDRQAIAALFFQFTFLFLLRGLQQPGLTFFNRLSEDKVFAAFILFPVFFSSTRFLLVHFNVRSVIYFLFSGFSLAFTHPVILAFSTFIIGLYLVSTTILRKEFKKAFYAILLLGVVIGPMGVLRFIEVSSADSIPYDLESALGVGAGIETRISYVQGTPYYGFNLERVKIETGADDHPSAGRLILSYSYLWIVGLGFLWSIAAIKSHPVAPFVAATSVLLLLSAIPYTGWLIGYFVSARMLWRVPWMVPIGLISVTLLNQCFHAILPRISINALSKLPVEKLTYGLVMGASSLLITLFSIFVYRNDWRLLYEIPDYKNTLEKLSALGKYLEVNIEQPSIFLAAPQASEPLTGLFTQSMMDYLPGLSSKSKVVLFRWFYPPYPINLDKLSIVFSPDITITPNQRINILKKNQVQFVLLDNNSIIEYYTNKPQFFDLERFGSYGILRIHGTSP